MPRMEKKAHKRSPLRVVTMLARQKLVIALINLSGGRASRLQIMKQAFLLRQRLSPDYARCFYEFLPYQYGPFSFALYHDLSNMASAGLITFPSDRTVGTTEFASTLNERLDARLLKEVDAFWSIYGKYRIGELVNLVYERYPWYASRSRRAKQSEPTEEPKCAVYTIGYEGMQIDGFLNLLLSSGIRTIIDVRKNAVSRVYGFYGSTLASIAKRVGIGYRHVPELGIPSEWRINLDSEEDLSALFMKYRGEVLPSVENSVANIASLIVQKPSVLMCLESNPVHCHRSIVAEEVSRVTGLSIRDLRWANADAATDDTSTYHRDDLSPSFKGLQGAGMHRRHH